MDEKLPEFDLDEIIRIDSDPLLRESDRGCVLILGADIENILAKMLKEMFQALGDLSSNEEKRIFDHTGPLGNFASKISLAKAVGVIDKNLHDDIQKLRRIRNMAAHESDSFSLSNDNVRQITSSMNLYLKDAKALPRYSFESGDPKESMPDTSETIMKGYGMLRADKAYFIHTITAIQLELTAFDAFTAGAGDLMRHYRENKFKKAREYINAKKVELDRSKNTQ